MKYVDPMNPCNSIDEFVTLIKENATKPPTEIDLEQLSVNGVFIKNTMDEYLRYKAVNASIIVKATQSIKAAKYEYDNQEYEAKDLSKDFETLGTIIHEAFLEPELFDKAKIEPSADLRTTDGTRDMVKFYCRLRSPKPTYKGIDKMGIKELRSILAAERSICKYTIVNKHQLHIIDQLKKNYYEYGGGIIPLILKGAISEITAYAQVSDLLFEEKIRLDALNIAENIGVDAIISLKSTSANSLEEFISQARGLKYGLKEAFYRRVVSYVTGRNPITIMIGLQTVAPYDVFVMFFNEQSMQIATKEVDYYIDMLNDSFKKKRFLGIESLSEQGNLGIIEIDLYGNYVPEIPCYQI